MIRTDKYGLNPTKKQQHLLNTLLFQMQTVCNDARHERRWAWQRSRRNVTYVDQWNRIRAERHALPDEMGTVGMLNATSIQQRLRRLDKACRAFYKGQRGAPRSKGRNRFKSIEHRHSDGCKLNGNRRCVQHVGAMRVRLHRPVPTDARIKHVVIKRSGDQWDVCLQMELPEAAPVVHEGPTVGIDVGLHNHLALSDGVLIDNPHWLRGELSKLRIAQRRLSRRKRFGSGWRKAARQVARACCQPTPRLLAQDDDQTCQDLQPDRS